MHETGERQAEEIQEKGIEGRCERGGKISRLRSKARGCNGIIELFFHSFFRERSFAVLMKERRNVFQPRPTPT
jgi:hypothetical protein